MLMDRWHFFDEVGVCGSKLWQIFQLAALIFNGDYCKPFGVPPTLFWTLDLGVWTLGLGSWGYLGMI